MEILACADTSLSLNVRIASANAEEQDRICVFLLTEGPNDWNYLPVRDIQVHVRQLGDRVHGIVATLGDDLVGVLTYELGVFFPQYESETAEDVEQGYIAEVVVSKACCGHGVGPKMLQKAISEILAQGVRSIYAIRHSDNRPSRVMMEKCGMSLIDEFDDPAIRPSGSRRTAVHRCSS